MALNDKAYQNENMPRTNAETLKALGKKIQKLRRNAKISQEELAAQLGITRVYMGFIEQGERVRL